ncbi:MAG TPA: hypothetical protein VE954_40250 [Oligoflexus sp.]|uniref:hypothetical protein n=1 Tax=Oligoflexus sp. TaxID=1971216 RepID=UPI002D6938D6|nr:hypothetical protein [Oligoflexus sp.]HYX39373.1 hypothetical protein [Oligoflexus sp.]
MTLRSADLYTVNVSQPNSPVVLLDDIIEILNQPERLVSGMLMIEGVETRGVDS